MIYQPMRRDAALGLALLALTATCPATELRLCNDSAEMYPWAVKDGSGLNSILLKMAAEKAEVSLVTRRSPWDACLRDIESGAADGGFAGSYSEQRSAFASFPMRDNAPDESRRLMNEEHILYRLKGTQASWDGKRISQTSKPVGVQRGYASIELAGLGVAVDDRSASPDELLQRLTQGDFDVVAMFSYVAYDIVKNQAIGSRIEKLSPPMKPTPYFLFFNRSAYGKHKTQIDLLWSSLGEARASPRYKAIEAAVLEK